MAMSKNGKLRWAGYLFLFQSVNDEAAHGPCVPSLVPIMVDGIGFL